MNWELRGAEHFSHLPLGKCLPSCGGLRLRHGLLARQRGVAFWEHHQPTAILWPASIGQRKNLVDEVRCGCSRCSLQVRLALFPAGAKRGAWSAASWPADQEAALVGRERAGALSDRSERLISYVCRHERTHTTGMSSLKFQTACHLHAVQRARGRWARVGAAFT
jgi:hypothetical protein